MSTSALSQSVERIRQWGSLVKFSHSVFALPFALAMAVVCTHLVSVSWAQLGWIIVCVVSARTAAMGFNRYVDRHIDARNPRTMQRELPAGLLTAESVQALILMASLVFLYGSWRLGLHCLTLAPLVLGWLAFYSYTKRFTRLAHVVLGVALACAPGGVWYALVGTIEMRPVWMMLAVTFWVAGFDIIYACQDVEFDTQNNLWSIPRAVGVANALFISRLLHVICILALIQFGQVLGLGVLYYCGVAVFAGLVASQHRLVSASDLSRVNAAFFTRNGLASVLFLIATCLERIL